MSNLLRKVTAAATALTMTMSIVAPVVGVQAADDSTAAANRLAALGVIVDNSKDPSKYNLGSNITRREMLKVMMNLSSVEVGETCEWKFADLPKSDWGCKYAEAALKAGFIAANKNFRPNDMVTEAEALKMVMQAKGIAKKDGVANWADAYAQAAVDAGILATAKVSTSAAKRSFVITSADKVVSTSSTDTATDSSDDSLDDLLGDLLGGDNGTSMSGSTTSTGTTTDTTTSTGTTQVVASGDLDVTLAPTTPATQDVPKTSSYVTYTKFNVTAGKADASLGTVTVKRTGLGSYKDFDKIWIEDENGTVIAKSKSITSSDEVVLTFSSYVLKAGSTATLSVVASHDTTNATTSDINTLSVTALSTGGNVTGSFPIAWNAMRISAYTTAKALLSNTVSTTTVDVGAKAVNLGEFKIQETETNSSKDLLIKSIRFKQTGSEDTKSLANVALYNDGTKVSTSTVIDGDYVTFLMGTWFVVTDGNTKNFQIKGDVIDGQDDRTIIFTLKDTFDVKAVEAQTGIGAVVDANSKVSLSTYTINAGKFNISSDISNPSSADISFEQKDVTLLVAKVDVAQDVVSNDKIKVYVNSTKTVETSNTTAAIKTEIDNNFKNVRLYVNGTLVDSTDTVSYTDGVTANAIEAKEFYYEFDSSVTLKDNDLIKVVAEVRTSSTATANDAIALDLDTSSFQTVEYTNGDSVAAGDKAGTASGNKFTITAASVSVTDNSGFGGSTKFVAGTKDAKIAKFLVNAGSAAPIKVKTLKFEITGLGAANEYSKLTNLKLKVDGTQVSTTKDATVGSANTKAYVTFENINLDIAKSGQKKLLNYILI